MKGVKEKTLLTLGKDGRADWVRDHHRNQRAACRGIL